MKKLLACTVAVMMAAAMMTACGDSSSDSSSKKETTTTTAAETEAAETEAAESEDAESEATEESAADESAAESEGDDTEKAAGASFTPISGIKDSLKNYEGASITFAADTDVNAFAEMFDEEVGGKKPGEEGYEGDEAVCELSVQDVGGVPMMKINELVYNAKPDGGYKYLIPKIRFDMNKLFKGHEEDMEKVFTIKADLVAIGRNQQLYDTGTMSPITVPWYGGAFGVNNNDVWNGNMAEYSMASTASGEDDETAWANQWAYTEVMCRPGIMGGDAQFSTSFDKNYITLMAWSVQSHIDFYVADIVLMDADGNVIEVPAENMPGGAEYTADELPNLDEVNSALTYDEAGNCVYEDETLAADPETIEGFDLEKAKEAAIAALE